MDGAALIESYRSRAVVWREMVLFPQALALEFLTDCVKYDLRLLGYDAFESAAFVARVNACPSGGRDDSAVCRVVIQLRRLRHGWSRP